MYRGDIGIAFAIPQITQSQKVRVGGLGCVDMKGSFPPPLLTEGEGLPHS